MSIANTGARQVRPIHPGEMLREGFLPDYGLTGAALADALCVSRQTVNELMRKLASGCMTFTTTSLRAIRALLRK